MSFARHNDLNGHLRMIQDSLEAIDVTEDERCTFICREAARESNGEYIRIEHF